MRGSQAPQGFSTIQRVSHGNRSRGIGESGFVRSSHGPDYDTGHRDRVAKYQLRPGHLPISSGECHPDTARNDDRGRHTQAAPGHPSGRCRDQEGRWLSVQPGRSALPAFPAGRGQSTGRRRGPDGRFVHITEPPYPTAPFDDETETIVPVQVRYTSSSTVSSS